MRNIIKMMALAFVLSFTVVACSNSDAKDCKADCKKECCEGKDKAACADKDKKACAADCKKECCADKDKKACPADCKKACCTDKENTDGASTSETSGDETVHTCTNECHDNPKSCAGHQG